MEPSNGHQPCVAGRDDAAHARDESARTRPVQFDIVVSMLLVTVIDFESGIAPASAASGHR
jgi:hypothetical protein